MITKFIKFTNEENKLILDYYTKNSKLLFLIFKKLINYTFDKKWFTITNKEVQLFNSIPISQKYKLDLPTIIYRGMTLSDEMIQKIKSEFKQNKKLTYKPKKQFSSWSTDKGSARAFSLNDTKLIFMSNLTKEIIYLDINLFYCICENLLIYLEDLKFNKKLKLPLEQLQLGKFLNDISNYLYGEQEILVFNKIEVNKIFTK